MAGELVKQNGVLDLGPFRLAENGLTVVGDPSFDEWSDVLGKLHRIGSAWQWWIGDALNYGEKKYGEMYSQVLDATEHAYQTLRNAKYIASRFELSRRRDNVDWSVYAEVASLPPKQADVLLEKAEQEELTKREVRMLAKQAKREIAAGPLETCSETDLYSLVRAGKKFGTIYADPPWQYGNQGTRAATDNHYGTMTQDELIELPVSQLAADKSHLHLWTTNAFLVPALQLIEKWGFEFKSTFVWVKPQLGIGNYWRCSHEIMLLGVRGGLTFEPSNVKSWLEHPRGEHSAKPHAVRELIERFSPSPRLELFARQLSHGWVSWGNEIERRLFDSVAYEDSAA